MKRKTHLRRVFGPNNEIKVIGDAGKDEQRHDLVWIFCRRCGRLTTARYDNLLDSEHNLGRAGNQSCGCYRDEIVKGWIDEAFERVPWPIKLKIWAAAQWNVGKKGLNERFAAERDEYHLPQYAFDQIVLKVHRYMQQMEKQVAESHWADYILGLGDVVENNLDKKRWPPGELTRKEYRKQKGRIAGWYAAEIALAQELNDRFGFLKSIDDRELTEALRRRGFRIREYVELADWLLATVASTQKARTARRKAVATDRWIAKEMQVQLHDQEAPIDPAALEESWLGTISGMSAGKDAIAC